MVNLQSIMLRFAEPFMDANYTKARILSDCVPMHSLTKSWQMDRIDPLYYARSSRINLKEETRINLTSDEAVEWEKQNSANSRSSWHL
jgi:ubiquitin conjugation factor E4 B